MNDQRNPEEKQTNNRHQRRRYNSVFRRAKIESLPRAMNDQTKPTGPCDWPGCQEIWMFVTMATEGGVRKPVARRCQEHRLG